VKRLIHGLRTLCGMRVAGLTVAGLGVVLSGCGDAPDRAADVAMASPGEPQVADGGGSVERGRLLTVHHGCGDCHGGIADPTSEAWLIGFSHPEQEFVIGPFLTRPRNLTPDNETGLGRFSERQIFNSLRYGLRPGETPDVEITSMTPGEGNFPVNPKYLAPPMPWPAFRHMSDQELWDIAAYLKLGLQPVSHRVEDSEGPPDFWASEYTPEKIGQYPLPPFPTGREMAAR
jgi:hypothetical protein